MKFGRLFTAFMEAFGKITFTNNRVSALSRNELVTMASKLRTLQDSTIPSNFITLPTTELARLVYSNLKILEKSGKEIILLDNNEDISTEDFVMSLNREDLLELAREGFEKNNYHIHSRYNIVPIEQLRCMVYLYLEQPDRPRESNIIKIDPTAGEPPTEETSN